MKLLIILFLSLTNVYAKTTLTQFFNSNEATNLCKDSQVNNRQTLKFVKGDDFEAYFLYSKKNMSRVVIYDLSRNAKREISIEGEIQDVLINETEVFYLTKKTLYIAERFTDKLVKKMRTLPSGMSHKKYATARGVYTVNNTIYIAHGEYGVVVFDREYGKYLPFINPLMPQPATSHRSLVTDVEGKDGKLYISYDNITLGSDSRAFEGLMIWDILTSSPQKIIPINQRREAYHLSHLTIDRDELFITNLFLNFRHKLKKLERDRVMRPMQRIWSYPAGKLVGRSLIYSQEIFGCFYNPNSNKNSAGSMKLK